MRSTSCVSTRHADSYISQAATAVVVARVATEARAATAVAASLVTVAEATVASRAAAVTVEVSSLTRPVLHSS